MVVSGVIAGRVFCGWACPMGTLQDLLARVPKLRALRLPRFGKVDRYLKGLKYLVLAVTIGGFYLLNERFAVPVRGHSNWSLDAVRVSWLTYETASRVRVVMLVAGVVLALGLIRVWCRYLCPLGALLTIGNRISLLRLGRSMGVCSRCGKYPRECRTYTTPGTADCVLCGDCIEGCPRGAVGFAVRYGRGVSGKSPPGSTAPEVIGPAAEDDSKGSREP
jgi:polyferredoxin